MPEIASVFRHSGILNGRPHGHIDSEEPTRRMRLFQSVPPAQSVENEQKELRFRGLGTKKGADSQRLPEKTFRTGFLLVVRALKNDVDLQ